MESKNDWEAKLCGKLKDSCQININRIGRVIIELVHGEEGGIISFIEKNHGIIKGKLSVVPSIVAEIPYSLIPDLAHYQQVKKIWVDSEINIK